VPIKDLINLPNTTEVVATILVKLSKIDVKLFLSCASDLILKVKTVPHLQVLAMYLNLLSVLSEDIIMAEKMIDAGAVGVLMDMFDEKDTQVLIYLSKLFAQLCPLLSQ
jgi:hypothetical protein